MFAYNTAKSAANTLRKHVLTGIRPDQRILLILTKWQNHRFPGALEKLHCWSNLIKAHYLSSSIELRTNLKVIGKAVTNNASVRKFREMGTRRYLRGIVADPRLKISPLDTLAASQSFSPDVHISAVSVLEHIWEYSGGFPQEAIGVTCDQWRSFISIVICTPSHCEIITITMRYWTY